MGWTKYSQSYGLGPQLANLFNDDNLVRFFFVDSDRKFCFLIKEMSVDEKQKSKSQYKFIRFNIPEDLKKYDIKNLNFIIDEFDSNEVLMKLLIKNEAATENYQRHFKLVKLLR